MRAFDAGILGGDNMNAQAQMALSDTLGQGVDNFTTNIWDKPGDEFPEQSWMDKLKHMSSGGPALGGAIGGGAGAVAGGLSGLLSPGEDEEGNQRSGMVEAIKRALILGGLGAGVGAVGGYAYKHSYDKLANFNAGGLPSLVNSTYGAAALQGLPTAQSVPVRTDQGNGWNDSSVPQPQSASPSPSRPTPVTPKPSASPMSSRPTSVT